jgi:hypothetical protein
MPSMEALARILIVLGLLLLVIGGLVFAAAKIGLPLGRLPGDFRFQTGNITCMIPLATSILLSVVLTILLNVIVRLLNK